MSRLQKDFYIKSAEVLAPELVGKLLCRRVNGEIIRRRITETECYSGFDDTASHASRGKTKRNEPMFSLGGITYIYLCYGMHEMLNIVSGQEGIPEAVLIRGVEGGRGPGVLTRQLKIGRELNCVDLCTSDEIWIEDDGFFPEIKKSVRIGIGYADKKDQEKNWRFFSI